MKIVDDRNIKDVLRKFKELPAWCVFEVPGSNGLYIKLDKVVPGDVYSNSLYDMNSVRLDYPVQGFKYTIPDTRVRPLDVEIHINGVKKF